MRLKYLFIMNSDTLTPDTYGGNLRTETIDATFIAVNSMDLACNAAQKLVVQNGIELIDLCGDFDEEKANQIKGFIDADCTIRWVKYREEELQKLASLNSMNPYGIIVRDSGFDGKKHRLLLESQEFNTIALGVADLGQAKEAAKEMVKQGIAFIELSSYFNREMCDAVIHAIDGAVPVGFAGAIDAP